MATSAMTDSQAYLGDVPQEFVFWCNDGQILRNLKELRDALEVMSEYTFTYHVNEAKNDFCNWVRDIIRDDILASQLLRVPNPVTAVRVVAERITFLNAGPASVPARPAAARKTPSAKKTSSARAPSSTSGKKSKSPRQTRG